MEDWTSGYVADLGYTYGYYPELNPAATRFALLSAGVVPPKTMTACELGFGQGVSVNIHAAASTALWWGTDFNPAQAGFARELAEAAGSGAQLSDEAFGEFCRRTDLPEMDYIGLHGIWSWINDENRAVIVDFVRRKLKVGGVLYVSYNTHPGWASAVPMRDLLTDHAEVMGSSGQGLVARIDAALEFADKLLKTNPAYVKANPQVAERLKKIASQDRHYVAHEYFNRDWEPMSFAKMAGWMTSAKLNFACSASFLDHVDALNLSPEQQALVREIPDPMFRQTVRDFCVNQQFRKDYWIKGVRQFNAGEQKEALDEQSVMLIKRAGDIKLNITGAQAQGKLSEGIYAPIVEALSDNKPKKLRDLGQAVQGKGVNLARLLQAVVVLMGKGDVQSIQSEEVIAASRPKTDKLNRHLMVMARNSSTTNYLASPVTGGGIPVPRFHQLFLLARAQGEKNPQDWVRSAWRDLSAQGFRLTKDGKTLATPEENIAQLTVYAKEFAEGRLAVLQALQIA